MLCGLSNSPHMRMCPPALVGGSGRYLAGEGGGPGRCSEECRFNMTGDDFGEFQLMQVSFN